MILQILPFICLSDASSWMTGSVIDITGGGEGYFSLETHIMNKVYIKAVSYYLPERVVTNEDVQKDFPNDDLSKIAKSSRR
jgi:hypothetical protein